MKTLKIRIKVDEADQAVLDSDQRVYSSLVRYSFNRLKDNPGIKINDVYKSCTQKFKFGSGFIGSATREAKGIVNRFKDEIPKFHFGDFKRFQKGLITKEEFKASRNRGLSSEGEACKKGNRYFKLDLSNFQCIYKRSKKQHINLKFNQFISKKQLSILERIHLCAENKLTPVTYKVKGEHLYITYDETVVEAFKQFKGLKKNRVLGIDLNPNYIGLSVLEFSNDDTFKVLHKQVFDLTELNETGSTGKVKFELQHINNQIIKLCNYYKCSKLVVEDLKFKKGNKFWSKNLNRLCKNKFRYSTIKQHLQTLCNTYGVEFVEVNAAYSSLVGNFVYGNETTPDMVASSIEIARRGYKKFEKGWFHQALVSLERLKEVLGNQWQKELELNFKSWKDLFDQIKKSKLKYRFLLDNCRVVFSKKHKRKHLNVYTFA